MDSEAKQQDAERLRRAAVTIQCAYRCYNARFELRWRRDRSLADSRANSGVKGGWARDGNDGADDDDDTRQRTRPSSRSEAVRPSPANPGGGAEPWHVAFVDAKSELPPRPGRKNRGAGSAKRRLPPGGEATVRRAKAHARAALGSVTPDPKASNASTVAATRRRRSPPPSFDYAASVELPALSKRFLPSVTAADPGWAKQLAATAPAARGMPPKPAYQAAADRHAYREQLKRDYEEVASRMQRQRAGLAHTVRFAIDTAHEEAVARSAVATAERCGFNRIYREFTQATLVLKTIESAKVALPTGGGFAASSSVSSKRKKKGGSKKALVDALFGAPPSCAEVVEGTTGGIYASRAIRVATTMNLAKAHYAHKQPPGALPPVLPPMLPYEARLCMVREKQRRYDIEINQADEFACKVSNFHSVSQIYQELGRLKSAVGSPRGSPHGSPRINVLHRQQSFAAAGQSSTDASPQRSVETVGIDDDTPKRQRRKTLRQQALERSKKNDQRQGGDRTPPGKQLPGESEALARAASMRKLSRVAVDAECGGSIKLGSPTVDEYFKGSNDADATRGAAIAAWLAAFAAPAGSPEFQRCEADGDHQPPIGAVRIARGGGAATLSATFELQLAAARSDTSTPLEATVDGVPEYVTGVTLARRVDDGTLLARVSFDAAKIANAASKPAAAAATLWTRVQPDGPWEAFPLPLHWGAAATPIADPTAADATQDVSATERVDVPDGLSAATMLQRVRVACVAVLAGADAPTDDERETPKPDAGARLAFQLGDGARVKVHAAVGATTIVLRVTTPGDGTAAAVAKLLRSVALAERRDGEDGAPSAAAAAVLFPS